MSITRRVLFPTDFSLGCQALVPTVRRMIESWQVEVTLLHVIERRQWLGPKPDLDRAMARLRAIAREGLRAQRVTYRLERGAPGERILEYVRSKAIDLVVLSAGGSSHVFGHPIGSVADQVLAEAPCSVWLDWGSARSRSTAGMYARQVGCALSFNDSDEYVLGEAAEISGSLEAGLTVIHAVAPAPENPVVPLWDQRHRDGALTKAKSRIEVLLRHFHLGVKLAVEVGSNHTVVSRAIQDHVMGLLVTGYWREAILAARGECPVLRLAIAAAASIPAAETEPRYAMAARRSA
jgi:nucleotide-binding universal stress UspA family protein